MLPHQFVHPKFKLNGLAYSFTELGDFLEALKKEGAAHEIAMANFAMEWMSDSKKISVATSGSTGTPKTISLEKRAMIHSAKCTGQALDLPAGTEALLCLSPEYIAGKMMLVRALTLGWHLHVVAPSNNALKEYDSHYDFAALVPYQVASQLEALTKVKKILIGGGPIPQSLEAALQGVAVKAYASYGMTETVSHIALRTINGPDKSETFNALKNVTFSLDDRECLIIHAPDLLEKPLTTNDMVRLENDTEFAWLGRWDNVVNSGGVKIHPEQIEQALSSKLKTPFFVAAEADELLGQRLVLVLERSDQSSTNIGINHGLFDALPKYSKPKKIYSISKFLYTETGKIKRNQVMELLRNYK